MAKKGYQRKDRFYEKAKRLGYKSRASFKLMELSRRFKLFRPGMQVVDLGCAPGSWLQVIADEIGPSGQVVGVDLEPFEFNRPRNVSVIYGDIREDRVRNRLLAELGRKVDVVVSDMAPHLSGIKFQDQYNSYELAEQALKVCRLVLKENGHFVAKIFPGEELEQFKGHLKRLFPEVKTFIPEATRKSSTEIYVVARGYRPSSNGN